ncbi:MAG: autotransporter outer membrane beta-barrel domain-containing protein, partial [Neisseriaceae bacterium]|nr:autotransporter outer membrane beta-barrel domain-containing protein [Neisseriaceae bacterium]
GQNMTLNEGSRLSVLGYFKDSTVQSGADVTISKTTQIAAGGFHTGRPATASNIQIDQGALINVFDEGTLRDSHIEGTVYTTTTDKNRDRGGYAINNTVSGTGKLYVYLGGSSEGTQINQGGMEYVQQQGQSDGTLINAGGKQSVTQLGTAKNTVINDQGIQQVSNQGSAIGTVVHAGGSQLVYNTATVTDSVVHGEQVLFENTAGKGAATAERTKVYGDGKQRVQNGATATDTELFDQGVQSVYTGSSTHNTSINHQAKAWIAKNAQATGLTTVSDKGQLQLQAADGNNGAYAAHVVLNGTDATAIVIAGANATDEARIGLLNGDGQIRFVPNGHGFTRLNVDDLAGNLHFLLNTEINGQAGDYVTIQNGQGQHKVTVADSGAEITQPGERSLDLITDHSAGAQFSLAALNGANINAVDGGSYLYYLHERTENGEKVWYLSASKDGETITPEPEPQPEPEPKPQPEPQPEPQPKPPLVDGDTSGLDASFNTQAMLAMAAAPKFIFNNELNNLRFRQGSLKENAGQGGVWARTLGGKTNAHSGNTHFALEQAGIEAGVDTVIDSERGQTLIGGFTSWGTSDVKHAKGGTSKIISNSLGAYATYFDQSGLYVDGVLKLNHFRNKLQAKSPTGSAINGDYSQNAFGGAVEAGFKFTPADQYFVEPYARLSYVHVKGANMTQTGAKPMSVKIDAHKSTTTELGVSLGKDIQLGKTLFTPYVKAAWAHEFQNNQRITTNNAVTWGNDFSGSVGKFGLGFNAKLNTTTALFTEINYTKGSKVEAPVQVNLGLRHQF